MYGIEKNSNSDVSSFYQSKDYLERPRLDKLLKKAIEYPLVIVCAGSGYGKTHAVASFLKEYDFQKSWMQVLERDNTITLFWENFIRMISLSWPEAGVRFAEIGFPETSEAFAKFTEIRREITVLPGKHIRVFDDFHLLNNPTIIRFLGQVINASPPNMTIILISRTMPEINLIGMMMHEQVFTINEDELCFTEEEITKYFNQLKLSASGGDIRNVYDDTQGWAFAVNLIGHSLAKGQKYERYALEAMKKNIFRLIDAEISRTVSESLWRFLLRVSLIDHLTADLLEVLAKDKTLIKEMKLLNAYIRYDFHQDTYLIHHLFLDYLRQKQDQILTDEERKETYQAAGEWCDANGYHMDALSYYEKSGDFNAIIWRLILFDVEMPLDMAQYALDIFDRALKLAKPQSPLFPSMYLKLKICLGQFEEASAFAEQYSKLYESQPETPERNCALTGIYACWGTLRMHMCTYTDVYDFDVYYRKMSEYFDKNPFKIIGPYKLTPTAWSSLVGTNRAGAMEEYSAAVSRITLHLSHVLNRFYIGFDDLVRGELYFYQRQFNDAEQYLKQSVDKAGKSEQYVTHNRALGYLMHIDFAIGDFVSATAKFKEMGTLLDEKDYGVRYTIYDIACGFYYLALEQIELIPEWLKGDFTPYSHPSFLENYANRIKTRYHYKTHKYSVLLAFIEDAMKHPMILFGKIELLTLKALSLYQLKRRSDALAVFTEAYHLAESNKIVVSFTEFGKDMCTLSSAALKDNICSIPKKWLEDINRISSIYAKRKSKMASEYRLANNLEEEITLTNREIAILKDLSEGISRNDIASNRKIPINTVKMVINNVYDKLYVTNLPEAIHVAMNHKVL